MPPLTSSAESTEFDANFDAITELFANLALVTCKSPRCIVSIDPSY